MNNDAPEVKDTTETESVTLTKEELARLLAEAVAAAKPEAGHRAWATKPVPSAMTQFTEWIAREYPELELDPTDGREQRLVMIASKAYRYFQGSDLRVR
jgi:hypothetical protein